MSEFNTDTEDWKLKACTAVKLCMLVDHIRFHLSNFKSNLYNAIQPDRNRKATNISGSTDVTSTDLVLAKGKTKEVYCCDIVVFIVLF